MRRCRLQGDWLPNGAIISSWSLPLISLTTFLEFFVPHPTCLMCDVHSVDTMIVFPDVTVAIATGSCAIGGAHASHLSVSLMDELPHAGLVDAKGLPT